MKKIKNKKYVTIIIFIVASVMGLFLCGGLHTGKDTEKMQEGIAKEIIRFHVIANSDSEVDQGVKMLVKNKVVSYLQKELSNVKTKKKAEKIILAKMPEIETIAKKTVVSEGYDYSCNVSLGKCLFPVKMYGDLIFPAGEYEALQVTLGKAEGRNWWCVMFPTLCFVDGTYSVVPDSSKELLKNVLNKEEYDAITIGNSHNKVYVKYKFKSVQLWKKVKKLLGFVDK